MPDPNENLQGQVFVSSEGSDVPPPPPVSDSQLNNQAQIHVAPITPQSMVDPSNNAAVSQPNVNIPVANTSDLVEPPLTSVSTVQAAGPPSTSDKPQKLSGKFPLKYLLVGLGALLFVSVISFSVWNFVINKPKPPEEVNLTYWGIWEDDATVKQLINEYQTQNKGVKITYVKQSKQDYRERLSNNLAKGGGPDIFNFHNSWVPMFSSQLSQIPTSVFDARDYQATFYPAAVKDLRNNAGIVGMPFMTDGLGLFVNEEIFKTLNKSFPTTWDELRRVASELTVRDESGRIIQAGVALGRTENVDHWEDILSLLLLQGGANLSNPTGNLAEAPLKYYTVFNNEDHVWDEALPSSTQAFASGKLAMYFAPSWRVTDVKTLNPNLSFKIVPVPQLPKNGPAQPDVNFSSYWAYGVSNKSKNSEAAWKFIKYLLSKEQLQKLSQGVAKTNLVGFPYSRVDMATLLETDQLLGVYVKEAPTAVSSYLSSNTFDGPTGINTRISGYYAQALNSVIKENKDPSEVLPQAAEGIKQVLSGYGVR
ncbi:MAG: hypothetical protein A3D24_02570 [Candidatus Blackburnbacteria bacterium RIFCSPHIGHO2_02_FULL_39_13]|uniref:ABC transporter substrate-binding protein n=1 Tax=Candidatus Blackburnbacteria bacterium RIFCSPLOWO2_01_FULL_40_20 TaxID=1797519 RepID=A0A1G1VEU9_9BACT|nr:MAG: Extracellular solute-binding protein family 1 [Microgenomates group bacterium GW2011_GWA2_39_19]OGY07264.1 MAG: hypothetical protein A2694_00155 [Candidatus Blackburnbacteria bacterium RIFCSPHIGHO2_01_FULL_40_17]OGY09264.1 MAG: hypothetical protein A3D24_02570 [Candidatus Blackburnbacteria bacterium RIFCSPHIGHO2_02_FULL_39_13]OGY13889.1 MAG: hypothetical protein A3A77_01160 [Candidatus Blackburnbacteria bacterium RIFCSPLOWO2_01_FULL_40_20]HBL51709.1 hypothetical protein [Candidatus Blac